MLTVLEVIGYKGDRVTLAGDDAGKEGIWLATDLEGFVDPAVSTVTKAAASLPGQRFISHRVLERRIVFKVTILNDDDSWEDRDARWRRLWSFGAYTTLRVTTEKGHRDLKCRLEQIEVDTRYDPHVMGATDVIMTVVADDPFWYAPDVVRNVVVAPGSSASITVDVANPTENYIFPKWVLEAPGTWTIPDYRMDSSSFFDVTMPAAEVGQGLVVDQDPASRQVEAEDNSLFWGKMNGVRFRGAIPPRTDKLVFEVSLADTDATRSAQLRLPRPYSRPWGEV